ncbi:glycosyltransferase [Actinoplanes sp. NBC_00393]|uniref:glycosyltransferase n=1 Tax=Actinoplanes sp. NBC_00393 TaxID=2975953 RepID=UPI002E1C438C
MIPAGTAGTLPLLLSALPPVHEVVVVVGPGEDTNRALPRAARVIRQTRTGLGNALACGVAEATGDVVVTLTGDGSCDPADVPRFVAALRAGADVVHGSRYLTAPGVPAGPRPGPFARCADLLLLWVMSVLFGSRPTDPGFGYRAFWRDTAGRLGLPRVAGTDPAPGDGPEIEPLLTVRTTTAGLHVAELPVSAYTRAATPLVPAVRALVAEYAEERRTGRTGRAAATTEESIVVLTGSPDPLINAPRTSPAVPEKDPARSWPAPNPRRPDPIDRRRGDRRHGERRADFSADRRFAGSVTARRPDGEPFARRRWRDNRVEVTAGEAVRPRPQGRPNLRVINGEATGPAGPRSGHLRSV